MTLYANLFRTGFWSETLFLVSTTNQPGITPFKSNPSECTCNFSSWWGKLTHKNKVGRIGNTTVSPTNRSQTVFFSSRKSGQRNQYSFYRLIASTIHKKSVSDYRIQSYRIRRTCVVPRVKSRYDWQSIIFIFWSVVINDILNLNNPTLS